VGNDDVLQQHERERRATRSMRVGVAATACTFMWFPLFKLL
jgi:hypothetical protein